MKKWFGWANWPWGFHLWTLPSCTHRALKYYLNVCCKCNYNLFIPITRVFKFFLSWLIFFKCTLELSYYQIDIFHLFIACVRYNYPYMQCLMILVSIRTLILYIIYDLYIKSFHFYIFFHSLEKKFSVSLTCFTAFEIANCRS